jgi:hypothetical protein
MALKLGVTDTRVRYLVLAILAGLGEAFGGKKRVKEPEPMPMLVPEDPAAEAYGMPLAWLAVAALLAVLFVVLAYLLVEHGKQPGKLVCACLSRCRFMRWLFATWRHQIRRVSCFCRRRGKFN